MERNDLNPLPEPVGKFIIEQKDIEPCVALDGSWWHYKDVITLMKRYSEKENAALQTKYDNILATESGHESKTENVWQSGYAAGHEAATVKMQEGIKEMKTSLTIADAACGALDDQVTGLEHDLIALRARADKMEQALKEIQRLATAGIFTHIKPESIGAANCIPIEKLAREALDNRPAEQPTIPQQGAVWITGQYERLYEQLKAEPERKIVCWLDYTWRWGNEVAETVRDICSIRGDVMGFNARGIGYGGVEGWVGYEKEKSEFLEECNRLHVQWLDESGGKEVNNG